MSITAFQGPFPTTWSSPPECTGISLSNIIGIDMAPSCLPKNFDPDPAVYYSPGTGCPSGYTAQDACHRSTDSITTTVTCCPMRDDLTMSCVADPSTLSSVWKDQFCTWSAGHQQTVMLVTTVSQGSTMTTAVTMNGGDGINAYGLRMVYEAKDVAVERVVPTSLSTDPSSLDPPPPTKMPSADLSPGAKAAVWATVPIVILALLIGFFFFLSRRRRNRKAKPSPKFLPSPPLRPIRPMTPAMKEPEELPPSATDRIPPALVTPNHIAFQMARGGPSPLVSPQYCASLVVPQELPWSSKPAELPAELPEAYLNAMSPTRAFEVSPESEYPTTSPVALASSTVSPRKSISTFHQFPDPPKRVEDEFGKPMI